MPIPKPMHCVAKAYFLFSLLNISAAFPVILAPVAPRGWPKAIAPPSKFNFCFSIPKSFMQARDCDAKASFNSIISISFIDKLALLSALLEAPMGPYPINSGEQP